MDIQEWLQTKGDYNTGLQLYIASGKANNNLIRLFTKKQSPAHFSKLKYELKKLSKTVVAPIVVNTPVKKSSLKVDVKTANTPGPKTVEKNPYKTLQLHEIPKELRPTYEHQKKLFTKVTFLHTDLTNLHPEQNALDLCLQIEELWDEIALCWKRLDFYRDHKLVLKTHNKDYSNLTDAQLLQKRNNVRSSITKHEKMLEKWTDNPPLIINLSEEKKYKSKLRKKEETILTNQNLLLELNKLIDNKE